MNGVKKTLSHFRKKITFFDIKHSIRHVRGRRRSKPKLRIVESILTCVLGVSTAYPQTLQFGLDLAHVGHRKQK